MNYLFLLYAEESKNPAPPNNEAEVAAMMAPWAAYSAEMTEAGVMRGGEALHPSSSATTLGREDGEVVFTDGPFAETREHLGGFYLVECDDLDAALGWAAKCPIMEYGRVEVRPIMDLG